MEINVLVIFENGMIYEESMRNWEMRDLGSYLGFSCLDFVLSSRRRIRN